MIFKAYAVTNEIDLNKMASQCNIPKKYTWEEPLILHGQTLAVILDHGVDRNQRILVFAFGSIVFINMSAKDEKSFMEYLKTLKPEVNIEDFQRYSDDYELREGATGKSDGNDYSSSLLITDQYAVVPISILSILS